MKENKELYELHADVCKIFSNPIRIEIIYYLKNQKLCVSELITKTNLSQANISQHLSIMKARGVISSERKGKNTYYSFNNSKIMKALDLIQEVLTDNLKK